MNIRARSSSGPAAFEPATWREVREILAWEVDRVTALLRSVDHPQAPAVGRWQLHDVAVHLSQAWVAVTGLVLGDLAEVQALLPDHQPTAGGSLLTDIHELSAMTIAGVQADPTTDLGEVAGRIADRAATFLDGLDETAMDGDRPWMVEGVRVTVTTLLCHLLNETVVHGYDIARADGRRWPIPRRHAAVVVEGFLLPILAGLPDRGLVDPVRAAGRHLSCQLHVRGGGQYLLAFDDGALRVAGATPGPVDCHLSVDPATFLLVAWHRRSQWPAIATCRLWAWGRKPWVATQLRSLLRTP